MLKSIEIPDKYNLFLKRVAEKYNRPVKKQLEHWIYEAIEKEKALGKGKSENDSPGNAEGNDSPSE